MLTDFDNTLKQLLVQRVPLDPAEVEVSFDCPKRDWAAKVLKPTINLYLYDLRENMEFRRSAWTTERGQEGPTGLRRPPVFVDLSYFVTTWARNVVDEHHLLWRVMATLMREPELQPDVLQGVLKQIGPPVKAVTAQADGVLRNPGEFWGALDNDLKPAVTYTATLCVNLDILVEAPLVLTKVIGLGPLKQEERQRLVEIGGTVFTGGGRGKGPRQPVAAAEVAFPQIGIAVRANRDGRYVVPLIPEGSHVVEVTAPSGATSQGSVQVRVPVGSRSGPTPAAPYDLEV